MSLAESLLEKLADSAAQSERHELAVTDEGPGWSAVLTLDRRDELGCLVSELVLTRTAPAPEGETLHGWAERLPAEVTGLLEPLKVLEVDELRNEALLRSETPSRRKEKRLYYELLLQGTRTAFLRRFQAVDDVARREQIAFTLTNEGLAKLVGDITRSASNDVGRDS